MGSLHGPLLLLNLITNISSMGLFEENVVRPGKMFVQERPCLQERGVRPRRASLKKILDHDSPAWVRSATTLSAA